MNKEVQPKHKTICYILTNFSHSNRYHKIQKHLQLMIHSKIPEFAQTKDAYVKSQFQNTTETDSIKIKKF